MNQPPPHPDRLQLPVRMEAKLKEFQRKVWMIKLAEGLLAAAFGLLMSYLLVFALDRVFETWASVRIILLMVGVLGPAVWFPLVCHKWVWKSRKLEQVARLLCHRFPRFGDHLLGIIELVNSADEQGRSESLCRAALNQVDREMQDKNLSSAVPAPTHRRWALVASVPAAAVLIAMLFVPQAGTNALARWLMPWKNIERYTFARIGDLPVEMVVPAAERFSLEANLSSDSKWKPDRGSAYIHGKRISAENDNDRFRFELPPLKSDSRVKLRVGDDRQTVTIRPKARPELASLTASITLPNYLQRSAPLEKDIRGGSVSVVQGSSVGFLGKATRELVEASVDGTPVRIEGQMIVTTPMIPEASSPVVFEWRDSLGLSSKTPLTLNVRVNEDAEPSLICRQLEKRRVMMEKDLLSFEIDAEDDFGIKTIGMEWQGPGTDQHETPVLGEKIIAAGTPESSDLTAVATFSPLREGVRPQAIELRLFAEDYLPGRPRIFSPTYTVFVLSEEEHAIWITRQLDQWYKQSLETYEQEVRLFKQNQAIRDLPTEQLDRPETRRRIEAQVAAEKSQARRLDALTSQGSRLVSEAARNDQFNVETLESLAEMLGSLKDISGKRMPSVADLLKKAADAPGSIMPGDPKHSVSDDKSTTAGSGKGGSDDKKKPLVPSVTIKESSMETLDDSKKGDEDAESGPPSTPKLTLPSVTLKDNSDDQPGSASPTQGVMEDAVDEQEELLAEFARVAEELQKLITNLEGSTFVKRLKAMAREQLKMAQDINATSVSSFGLDPNKMKDATRDRAGLLAARESGYTERMKYIVDDLQAYSNRVPDGKYKTVLAEMNTLDVTRQFHEIAEKIVVNEPGSTIAHAELLADTLDRWAEQLVGPG